MALYQKKNGIRTLVNAGGYGPEGDLTREVDWKDFESEFGDYVSKGKSIDEALKMVGKANGGWTLQEMKRIRDRGLGLKGNADTIPMDKDELVKEHEDLTGLLGKTAEELEAEKKKQEKELAEYKANATADEEKHLKDLEDRLQKATGKEAEKIQSEIDKILFPKKNSDNAIDLDAAAQDAREGFQKGLSEANVRELVKQKYKFDERDDDILNAVMEFTKKQLKTNSQKQIPDDDASIGADWDAKSREEKGRILKEALNVPGSHLFYAGSGGKAPVDKKWSEFTRADRISIIGAW